MIFDRWFSLFQAVQESQICSGYGLCLVHNLPDDDDGGGMGHNERLRQTGGH